VNRSSRLPWEQPLRLAGSKDCGLFRQQLDDQEMYFSNWQEFLHMGGYALYVWLSYGLTVAVLGWTVLAPWFRHRHLQRQIAQRSRREQRRKR
jgi:heme exporter protein D